MERPESCGDCAIWKTEDGCLPGCKERMEAKDDRLLSFRLIRRRGAQSKRLAKRALGLRAKLRAARKRSARLYHANVTLNVRRVKLIDECEDARATNDGLRDRIRTLLSERDAFIEANGALKQRVEEAEQRCGLVAEERDVWRHRAKDAQAQVDMLAGATRERDRLRSLYWETCKTCENECRNEDEWQKCYLKQQLDDAEKTYDAILSSLPSAGERWQAMERFIKDVECSYEAYASEAEDRPNELAVFRHVRQALDDFAKVVSE